MNFFDRKFFGLVLFLVIANVAAGTILLLKRDYTHEVVLGLGNILGAFGLILAVWAMWGNQ